MPLLFMVRIGNGGMARIRADDREVRVVLGCVEGLYVGVSCLRVVIFLHLARQNSALSLADMTFSIML